MFVLDREGLEKNLRKQYHHVFEEIDETAKRIKKFALEMDRTRKIPSQFWEGLSIAQLNRAMIPLEYGGAVETATALRRTIIAEKFGFADPAMAVAMPGPGISMPPVLALGTNLQKERFFKLFLSSPKPVWGAFATTEPECGTDAYSLRMTATRHGDHYVLNGQKSYIGVASIASWITVFANTAPERGKFGIRAFMVHADTPGLRIVREYDMLGMRILRLSELSFEDCQVQCENLLGFGNGSEPRQDAFTGAQNAWDFMRPLLSSIMVGASQSLCDKLRFWCEQKTNMSRKDDALRQLKQFDMDIMRARMLCIKAASCHDNGQFMSHYASMAKRFAPQIAQSLAHFAINTVGLDGLRSDPLVYKFYRDAKTFDILEGTGDIQSQMITKIHQSRKRNFKRLFTQIANQATKK